MQDYTDAHNAAFTQAMIDAVTSEARALMAGVSAELAAEVGIQRISRGARKCAPNLTDDRVIAVGANGKRLPHNARGVAAPGSVTRRGKAKAGLKTHTFQHHHAHYVDGVRRITKELDALLCAYKRAGCRKRKQLRGPVCAVWNKLNAELSRGM